jgi:hypothetical protein
MLACSSVTLFCKSLRKEIFSSAPKGSGWEENGTAELFGSGVGDGNKLERIDSGLELFDEACVEGD